jgi:hypothetical protein
MKKFTVKHAIYNFGVVAAIEITGFFHKNVLTHTHSLHAHAVSYLIKFAVPIYTYTLKARTQQHFSFTSDVCEPMLNTEAISVVTTQFTENAENWKNFNRYLYHGC